jgi:signal transduction histidine kinase
MGSAGRSGDAARDGLSYAEVEHELKTPLTSIRSLSEILLDFPDLDAAERRRFLRLLVEENERLTAVVQRLLDDVTLQQALG